MLALVTSPRERSQEGAEPHGARGLELDPRARLAPHVLEALQRAERSVLDAALRALFPEVRARLHRLLGPRHDLDDATQDALIEIARALPSFEGRASLSTLAGRITVRTAFRYFGRPHMVSLDANEPTGHDDPEARVANRETLRRLYRCLDKLSPKRRVAFVLCAIEGLSPSEAGEIEGVPSLVMRARLLQARSDVARWMKGDPWVEALVREEGGEP